MPARTYPDAAMADVIAVLLEHQIDPDLVNLLATDLPGEYQNTIDARSEAAWEAFNGPEAIAARGESYREHMEAAGRGHLLR